MKPQPPAKPAPPEAPQPVPAVRLRAIEPGDLGRSLLWVNDPEITRFTGTLYPVSSIEEDEWYRKLLHDPTQRAFALETDGGRHVGNAGFRDIQPVQGKAELWIYIGEKSKQNAGLGTAAIEALVRFGFERMNLHRIWIRVFSYNERALKAFQRCGFAQEGLLRDDQYRDGRYHDTHVLAILRGA
jgi:RimJ/RimL family protein N-acetyltransferase